MKRLGSIILVIYIIVFIVPENCLAQSIFEGFKLSQESPTNDDYQLAYLAVLMASSIVKNQMVYNILELRSAMRYLNGRLTEDYSVQLLDNGRARIEYTYHFGKVAYITITSEALEGYDETLYQTDIDIPTSFQSNEAPSAIDQRTYRPPVGDPLAFFAEAETAYSKLVMLCPYEGDIIPPAEIVLVNEPYTIPDIPGAIVITITDLENEMDEILPHLGEE